MWLIRESIDLEMENLVVMVIRYIWESCFDVEKPFLTNFLASEDKLSEFENSVLRKRFGIMETDPPTPNPEDLETCSRILDVFEYQIIKKSRLTANEHILYTMDSGITRKTRNISV
ncbi:hypothetical protein TNCV_1818631 [Trichonephila clavipes]|nr:hypothetical protein TNCV_1818631 [Trichonephila clavipes]